MIYIEGGDIIKIILLLLLLIPTNINAQEIKLLNWNLVDNNNHLDYKNYSIYYPYIKKAIKIWNNEKQIIRKDNIKTIADVVFTDQKFISNGIVGITQKNGLITFSKQYMNKFSPNQKLSVCIHEIGHALGLNHRYEIFSVMFPYVSKDANIELTEEDKINLKAAIKTYKRRTK